MKIIRRCWKIAEEHGVKFDHSYVRKVPKLLARFRTRGNRLTKARRKAGNKLKTTQGAY